MSKQDPKNVSKMLIEFFYVNKISRDVAATSMLGLYMAACSQMGISYKDVKRTFERCLKEYKKDDNDPTKFIP